MLNVLRVYYRFLWRYPWLMAGFVVSAIAAGVLESILPYFYKLLVDSLEKGTTEKLLGLVIMFTMAKLIKLIVDNIFHYLGDAIVIPSSKDARMTVFRRIQELDFAYHQSRSTGSLISAIKRGDGAFFSFFYSINTQMTRTAVSFVVMVSILGTIDFKIALAVLLSMMINLVVAYFLVQRSVRTRNEFNEEEDKISEVIVDNLINYETVKLFANEEKEYQRLGGKFDQWVKKFMEHGMSFRYIDMWVGVIGNLGIMTVLLMGIKEIGVSMTIGDYIMIFTFVTNFYYQFFELIYEYRNVAKHQTDIQKYFSILGEEVKIKDPTNPVKVSGVEGEIEFKNIIFTYPGGKKGAVRGVDLKIRQGQSIALVGHSGVGKTTLVKLLMRFYDPDKGEILLDGINIKKFNKSQLRSFMGVVPQEPILFNNTIRYNIAYGAKNVTLREIGAAAKMANLDHFIQGLADRYKTNVGERGVKLSGGQKQRLAIARMILADPKIIIFDEATSQLDSESERKIQEAFWRAAENKTTIIIAHRLSTVARADKIVVMRHGKIAEIGSHRELLQRENSLYSKFWKLQAVN